MASTGENLRTLILADATVSASVGTRCYQNTVPVSATMPYIWFMRRGLGKLGIIGEVEEPYNEYFDLECVSDSVDTAIDLADAVRSAIDGHSGEYEAGGDVAAWIDVLDQSDDYQIRNLSADEVLSVASLNVEVTNP